MRPADDLLYEYAVIRYVPRIDREEFMNIGLIMLCKRRKWLYSRISLDRGRLHALDPGIKFDALLRQSQMFERPGLPFPDLPPEEQYRWLTAAKSAVLQTSPSHPGIITAKEEETIDNDLLRKEFDRLFAEIVLL